MAAKTVTIEEAARRLSELVDAIRGDDEVILAKGDEPVAKIVRLLERDRRPPQGRRVFGQCKGEIWVSEDFDEPLPDDFWLGGNP